MNTRVFLGVMMSVLPLVGLDAQERTVGLMLNREGSFEGYTLFSSMSYPTTYLINNQGLVVNTWESDYISGQSTAYLSPDGYLYRTIQFVDDSRLKGISDGIQKLDWDGNLVWYYELPYEHYSHHHDMEVLPSGNVLLLLRENKDTSECIEAGRDTTKIMDEGLFPDIVLEIAQKGDSSGVTVWEWHVWDHLVQKFDSTKENYGEVIENPQLININYYGHPDWTHINSVDYNPEFDQIMLTSRNFSEVWILDHSTTTQEARGSTGGDHGKGGDLLYRWGNPRTYKAGTTADQKLFYQHDAQWIPYGCPGEGNILVFNNGTDRGYSSVEEIVPPVDDEGNYSLQGTRYGPEQPMWIWTAAHPYNYFAPYFSGAQRLPNGNTLMCHALKGEFLEVTNNGDTVWRYINPVTSKGPAHQGDSVEGGNAVFKIRRYPPDFPGFVGRDLSPKGPIEKYSGVDENFLTNQLDLEVSTPVHPGSAFISYHLDATYHVSMKLYNSLGQEVRTLIGETKSPGAHSLTWDGTDDFGNQAATGVYFCIMEADHRTFTKRVVLIE